MRNGRAQIHFGVWLARAAAIAILSLAPALSAATGSAAEITPPPKPKPYLGGVVETQGVRLSAHLAEGVPPLNGGLSWQIIDDSGAIQPIVVTKPRPAVELPPGQYHASATIGLVDAKADFEVRPGEVTDLDLILDAGALDLTIIAGPAPMGLESARIDIHPAGGDQAEPLISGTGGRLETVLPEGDYDVEATLGLLSGATTLTVKKGATTRADVVLQIGYIIADALAAPDGEDLAGANFALWRPDAGETGANDSTEPIARSGGRHAVFEVAPGEYRLTADFGLATGEETVSVENGRLARAKIILNASRLDLEAIGPEPGLGIGAMTRYRVFEAGADGGIEPIVKIEAASPQLRLPAGDFTVEAERGGLIARETVSLAPGVPARLRLVLGAGQVEVTAAGPGRDLDASDIQLSAIPLLTNGDAGGPPLVLGWLSSAPVALPAGRYRLTGELQPGGAEAVTTVSITAGARTQVPLDFNIGNARLKVLAKPGGDLLADAHLIVRRSNGGDVAKLIGAEVELALSPGIYKIFAGSGTRTAEGELVVVAGNTTTIELVPN